MGGFGFGVGHAACRSSLFPDRLLACQSLLGLFQASKEG
jgi:hypothetical protein